MTNILAKPPAELLVMLPDLSDPELNALAAKWCEGWDYWPDFEDKRWASPVRGGDAGWHERPPSYTSDWRDAGRLLVKYEVDIDWENGQARSPVERGVFFDNQGGDDAVRRAITKAALAKALRDAMEGE